MTPRIAIVGSGPAGCYVAQALRKALPEAEISVLDRLCVPYGLVRYGVAPDHQGTKGVTRQFARLFERQDVDFLGNIEVGRDIALEELRGAMHAVVIATGLYADRRLGVPGDDLPGVYGSGAITRAWNGHPDSDVAPSFGGRVAVIGNGNVAADVVRLLAKAAGDFAGSDVAAALIGEAVEEIHVIGRGSLAAAKFDVAMLKEIAALSGVRCDLAEGDSIAGPGEAETPIGAAMAEAVKQLRDASAKRIVFHAGWTVARVEADGERVAALTLRRPDGSAEKRLACDSVITAIGFDDDGAIDRASLLQDASADGVLAPGLFAAGWFRRGSQGTIPENRTDAQEVAAAVAAWLSDGTHEDRPGRKVLLDRLGERITTYRDWLAIDAAETDAAEPDRCRRKLRTWSEMKDVIEKQRETA
ncbi:MAG: FAD-dependent oxidoreductase [Pseudomonadota bacterium]